MRFQIVFLLSAAVVAGCASNGQQSLTAKEQAMANWNATRAGVLLSLAHDQYTTGNFDKCRQTLNEAGRMDNAIPELHILSAKLAIEQGQLEMAEKELQTARTLDAKDEASKVAAADGKKLDGDAKDAANAAVAQVDYLDGVIYQRWEQPAKSLQYYQAACDKAPSALAYLMAKAETLVALDRQEEALKVLQAKVSFFEHSPVIRDAVGMLLLQQHHPDGAVEMFRRASILAPDELGIREHLAMALFQDKQYLEASDVLDRLLQEKSLAERSDLRLTLAECQLGLGRVALARISAQAACDAEPSCALAWLTLAKISMQLNDPHRAEVALRRALDLEPNSAQGYLLMGYLRLQQEKLPEALDCFNQSAQLDPADSTSLCMSGYVMAKMNHPHEAQAFYAKALKVDPTDDLAGKLLADVESR